jgi:hypothetical protein
MDSTTDAMVSRQLHGQNANACVLLSLTAAAGCVQMSRGCAALPLMMWCCLAAHWSCLPQSLTGWHSWQAQEVDKWCSSCQVHNADVLLLSCAAHLLVMSLLFPL